MIRIARCGACLVVVLAWGGPVFGQSLADVARQEAERRGKTLTPARVYTNGDLTPDFTKPPSPDPAPEATPAKAPEQPAADQPDAQEAGVGAGRGVTPREQQEPGPKDDKTEEYWRERAALIRSQMTYMAQQVDQLRERLASSGGDPAEREIVQRTFAKAESDLRHINDEWVRFEQQARDRKVPDHWIR